MSDHEGHVAYTNPPHTEAADEYSKTAADIAANLTPARAICLRAYRGDVTSSSHDLDLPFTPVEKLRYMRLLVALNAGKRGVRRVYQITPLGRAVLAALDAKP